jgi:hypothetical protein
LDPNASAGDKALAAAQLAATVPGLRKDVQGFAEALREAGVANAEQLAKDAAVEVPVRGLAPGLAGKLTAEQVEELRALALKVGPERLEAVLKNVADPEALGALVRQLQSAEAGAAKRLLTPLEGLGPDALQETLKDPDVLPTLSRISGKLDEAGAQSLRKIVKGMDADGVKALARFVDVVPAKELKSGLKLVEAVAAKAGGEVLGKSLKVLDDRTLKTEVHRDGARVSTTRRSLLDDDTVELRQVVYLPGGREALNLSVYRRRAA